jgi:hypothetical protein
LAARRIPLDAQPEYEVVFVPELAADLHAEAKVDELVVELETQLSLRLEHIAGRRTEKIEGSKDMALYKYRPHADNDVRFVFATEEKPKRRVVLGYWPRKRDYRKQDLKTAAQRFKRFLESHNS